MIRTSILATLTLATAAQADLLVNGGFETMPNWGAGISGDGGYTLLTGTQIPGWTLEANHGATIHNTATYPFISGNYSLNTDGEGWNGHNVNIYQDFTAPAGQVYTLTFNWQNWYTSTSPLLDISIVDTANASVLAHGSYGILPGLHTESFTFTATGNTLRLRIMHAPESGYNDNTFIVDNFAIELVPSPTSAAALGISGLLSLARRRR